MRQKGNPVLNHIKSIPWEYSDIPCDYVLGATTCALFLSLKYHRLHPEYIYGRIQKLGKLYNLRVLLTMVDIENHETALQELSKTSMINNFTIILAWSAQEAGRYLELFKSFEHASPSAIRARQAESWQESLTEFVTTLRNINKTDAASLVANFGSLRAAVNAEPEELSLIPGWGEKKIKSWHTTLREPFRVKRSMKSTAQILRQESTLDGIGDGQEAGRTHAAAHAIPISSTRPNTTRQGEQSDTSEFDASRLAGNHKRLRAQGSPPSEEFNEEDESAMLAAEKAVTDVSDQPPSTIPKTSSEVSRGEPELSVGIAAALAKYRSST